MARIRLNLKNLSITDKLAKGRQIVTAMTNNASFPNPNPPLTEITASLDASVCFGPGGEIRNLDTGCDTGQRRSTAGPGVNQTRRVCGKHCRNRPLPDYQRRYGNQSLTFGADYTRRAASIKREPR
jgi:hypothetical protein